MSICNLNILYLQFEELKECNKVQDKINILNKYKNDSTFKYILEFLLDKQKKTGISTTKLNKECEQIENKFDNDIIKLIDYLLVNNTGRTIDIQIAQAFINQIDKEAVKEFVEQLVTKKYKCGVTDKTARKAIPELTRNWEMRKGNALDLKNIDKQLKGKDILVTLKIDGFRYPVIKRSNTDIDIRSSNGYRETDLIEIEKEFMNPNIPIGVYDCECVAIGNFNDSTERYIATSKILSKKGEKRGVKMMCFDYIQNIETFDNYEIYKRTCLKRKTMAQEILINNNGCNKYKFIEYLKPIYISGDDDIKSLLEELFNDAVNKGEEGLVIDIADAPYERKKGNTMFKLKPCITGDFKVIDFEEGQGKNKGKLGAFIIEYKNNTVNIGSGIPDKLREDVWNNKEFYRNKLIEVIYFGESHDENGKPSIRLNRFKRLRHDKNPNDISYD